MVTRAMRQADSIAKGNKDIFLDVFEETVKKVIRENPNMLYKDYWRKFGK